MTRPITPTADTTESGMPDCPAAATVGEQRLQLGLAGRGALRWVAADVTDIVREVRDRLDLTPVAAAALGRAVAGASMLLRLATKTPSRLVLDIRGDGPLRQVLVEVDQEGNIRGTVGDPQVVVPDLPNAKLAVGTAVGSGRLRVLREYGDGGSYHSHVELVSGEIGEDLAYYLTQSEQSKPAVLVGVLGRKTGIAAAGGVIVEMMPGAPEETVARLERNVAGIAGVSWLLEQGGVEGMLDAVLAGLDREVKEARPLRYHCRCSRERLQQHLVLLSAEDRNYLAEEDGAIEADCVFCGNHYRFTAHELVPADEALPS
ncbi:MAG TPA: Hsp33 family molecular chaperone HslO [Thermoanaerobaculia bacterium]|nr:Hsp33 family molecular chaperone HslO [Thermoanaerobaculia bacterium]